MHYITDAIENYLEAIYLLKQEKEDIHAIDISKSLNISKPSVSRAMKRLVEGEFITVNENDVIYLTEKGMKVSEYVYEKHIVLRDFFIKIGLDEYTADKDACKIEHVISDECFQKLKEFTKDKNSEE